MPEYPLTFFGRVHPERAFVSLSPIEINIPHPTGAQTTVRIEINVAQIVMHISDDMGLDVDTLHLTLQSIASNFVDAFGFSNGCGYRVEITSFSSSLGRSSTFGIARAVATPESRGVDPANVSVEFDKIVQILINKPEASQVLRQSIADFRQAILETTSSPFHCFRAVECLMYYFDRNNKKGKPKLCSTLNIDLKWLLKTLEIPAGEIRHGKMRSLTADDINIPILAARTVIERFVELVSKDLDQLPVEQFPVIS